MTGKKRKHTLKEIWVNKPKALRHIKFLLLLIFFFFYKECDFLYNETVTLGSEFAFPGSRVERVDNPSEHFCVWFLWAVIRDRQRLQNLSVWLEVVGRQESIGLFLQPRKGRQWASGVTLCQGHTLCFGPACTLAWLFRIPRPPLTVFPTMEELASHQIKLWGSPRGCQMKTILFVQQSYHPRAGCVTSPARAVL